MAKEAAEAGLPRSISEIKTFRDIARAAPRSVKMPRLQLLNAVGDTGFFEGQQPTVQRAVGDGLEDGLEDWRGDDDWRFSDGYEPRGGDVAQEVPAGGPETERWHGGLAAVQVATRIGSHRRQPRRGRRRSGQ